MSTAAARRAYAGPALFSFGFRPFFLVGSIWAALVVPLWVWSFMSGGEASLTRDWHIHEMLFGYLAAVVAGFLTTAVPNWTGRMPVIGTPLAGLFALWVAGRLAMLFGGWTAGLIDSLFLVAFAGVIWREILTGRNWRNLPVCLLVSLFAIANIAFHAYPDESGLPIGIRLAIAAAVLLIALIGGRIVPSFTRNWLRAHGVAAQPASAGRFDQAVLALTLLAAIDWAFLPAWRPGGWLLVAAGAGNLARLARWRGWLTLPEALLWILHLGYAWLGAGLLLLGATLLSPAAPRTAGIHAITAGAVGVMTLAVMSRATRGHTGRPLHADPWTVAIYLAANAAAVARVAAAFTPAWQMALLELSAVLWSAAFGGFAAVYGPMLTTPRRAAA